MAENKDPRAKNTDKDGNAVIDEAVDPQAQVPPDNYMQPNPDEPLTAATQTDIDTGFTAPSHAPETSASSVPPAQVEKGEQAGLNKLAKAAGVKSEDVIGYSAEANSIVTAQGQKFRLAADGKTVVKLSGPPVEA